MELGFGGSPEVLELGRLGQIAVRVLRMMSVLMLMLRILPTAQNHPKGGLLLLRTIYLEKP